MIHKPNVQLKRIEQTLKTPEMVSKISILHKKFESEICSELPNAFWERKRHLVELPYISGFDEQNIPTKARPIQMNHEMMEICKTEINHLLEKGIIRPSNSPWSCSAFYVNNSAEKERGTPRLVINYKPPGFDEQNIPTKARPIQMNHEMMEICKAEINHLLEKGIIRPSNSPWSCSAFYVNNSAEKERGTPRLVINYKPLNVFEFRLERRELTHHLRGF